MAYSMCMYIERVDNLMLSLVGHSADLIFLNLGLVYFDVKYFFFVFFNGWFV
jgi:hypothetical protein